MTYWTPTDLGTIVSHHMHHQLENGQELTQRSSREKKSGPSHIKSSSATSRRDSLVISNCNIDFFQIIRTTRNKYLVRVPINGSHKGDYSPLHSDEALETSEKSWSMFHPFLSSQIDLLWHAYEIEGPHASYSPLWRPLSFCRFKITFILSFNFIHDEPRLATSAKVYGRQNSAPAGPTGSETHCSQGSCLSSLVYRSCRAYCIAAWC